MQNLASIPKNDENITSPITASVANTGVQTRNESSCPTELPLFLDKIPTFKARKATMNTIDQANTHLKPQGPQLLHL
jgi:hypothetical protein